VAAYGLRAVTATTHSNDTANQAVDRGLRFLSSRQLPSGQFPVEATMHEGQTTVLDQSLFATTHIVYSLDFVHGPEARAMIDRAIVYFLAEMSHGGLWRYWNRDAQWGGRPIHSFIPADMDDTANVSFLLARHGVAFPDNRRLLLLNRNRAGLFYTWLMMRPVRSLNLRYWWAMLRELTVARLTVFWKTEAGYLDVDGVVNANVLLYLGQRPETSAAVSWLIHIVETGCEASCDKWYRDAFSLYYAISRSYRSGVPALGVLGPAIVARLRAATLASGQIGDNALQTALAINTLLALGACGETAWLNGAVDHLLRTQAPNGSWPSAPYYFGGPKRAVSWGSAELTTGLCLEALARYEDQPR
jgi:hypothetical protein